MPNRGGERLDDDDDDVPWRSRERAELLMLYWALIFLVMALVTALLGYGPVVGDAAPLLKIVFLTFFILALLAFVAQAAKRT